MKSNIEKLVDFQRLKDSNDKCLSWAKKLKIGKNDYVRKMLHVMKNPEIYAEKLKGKQKNKFMEDAKTMFYAFQVENILCEQYAPMVINIMKKFKLTIEKFENIYPNGLMAVRSSVWQYRNHKIKASFTTFAHRAIFMRVLGIIHREKRNRLKIRPIVSSLSNYDNEIDINSFPKNYEPEYVNFDKDLNTVIKDSSLTEQEEFMIRAFVNRKVDELWYGEYIEKYRNAKLDNRKFSRQTIYNQLLAVQTKIMESLQRKAVLPENFQIPTIHRGDFK